MTKDYLFNNSQAFTLIEAMVTVIIVGTIMSLAITNYQKTLEHSTERQSAIDLMAMVSAEKIYYARNGQHWPTSASFETISAINTNLGLSLSEPDRIIYQCKLGAGGGTDCQASYSGGKWVLSTFNFSNGYKPFCLSGSCPTCKSDTAGSCF